MPGRLNLTLGAPGIYSFRESPVRRMDGVRMDVCAFLGVAPRGPAREPVVDPGSRACQPDPRATRKVRRTVPVAVESFDEYRSHFGGFEGPGLLPYAVASFFEQGGVRAYVCRIVHEYGGPQNDARVATGVVGGAVSAAGPLGLRARSEGSWANGLRAELSFQAQPLDFHYEPTRPTSVFIDDARAISAGTLLRFRLPGNVMALRFVTLLLERHRDDQAASDWEAVLEGALPAAPTSADVLEGRFRVEDEAGRSELFERQGLSVLHPRWLAATLYRESRLVFPDSSWVDSEIKPDASAEPKDFGDILKGQSQGMDAYAEIVSADFFDETWTPGNDEPGDGIAALALIEDLSLLVAPDLYSPAPLAPIETISDPKSLAGAEFETCVEKRPEPRKQTVAAADLAGLRLDPRVDLTQILALQARLVEFAESLKSFIVLLDVPPTITVQQILRWRTGFDSAYAAAYHPWLQVARRDDYRDVLILVPPSASAAGIIARREIEAGLPFGPANVLAANVVNVRVAIPSEIHDRLHPEGINVFLKERDGVRLTAARTLSRDSAWRQLSVRRLVTMIRRSLERQMQWAVFEPNGETLQADVGNLLTAFMRGLFRAGAFRGQTEEESFFVKCDDELNDRPSLDAGRFIAHIGVAPSEPLEFIVLRLSRDGDGTLLVGE